MEDKNFKAKKSLGQNFLHAPHIISAMVHAARVGEAVAQGAVVLEVGPGKGALTESLLETGTRVLAVEKDDRAIPFLQEKFAEHIKKGNLSLIHGDILELDIQKTLEQNKYIVVANIPYYITGEMLRKFLENKTPPQRMVLMVQKEVAERIVTREKGGNGLGKESILSISVKAFGSPHYVVTVPARNFRPEPNVDSAVILIDNISHAFFDNMAQNIDKYIVMSSFFTLVKTGFAHKRKVLISNLREKVPKELLLELWTTCGLNEKARAEEISLENWGKMLDFLTAHKVIL